MTPSMVTLLIAVLCPTLNHALAHPAALPSSSSQIVARQIIGTSLMPNNNNSLSLHRRSKVVVGRWNLQMRGGGDTDRDDETTDDDDEYDVSSSDDEEELTDGEDLAVHDTEPSDEEEDEEEKAKKLELMYKQAELSQQSRNFAITTALWSSLFFDSILNKVKRVDLFPAGMMMGGVTIAPAAALASGFALSSGVAFLIWRDLEIRSDSLGGEESHKGDWFLSLSSNHNNNGKDDDVELSEKFAAETRQRLLIHLSLFGILNLGAHAGLLLTDQAPFLGMSAAIINVHNTLACLSALVKEKSVPELITQVVTWPISLFKSDSGEGPARKEGVISFLFRVSAVAAWMSCIPVCKSIFALTKGATALDAINIVDKARELALTVAYLARLTLFAGVAKTLHAASSTDSIRNHPFFATLSGMLSIICLGVGGTMLYSSLILNVAASKALLGDALLVVLALVAGYNSITSFIASKSTA